LRIAYKVRDQFDGLLFILYGALWNSSDLFKLSYTIALLKLLFDSTKLKRLNIP